MTAKSLTTFIFVTLAGVIVSLLGWNLSQTFENAKNIAVLQSQSEQRLHRAEKTLDEFHGTDLVEKAKETKEAAK